ncbi:hypothetical protein HER10_EVM0006529 [Colletotrichum scovillei]|uniref:Integral membrane protein n=1 Tax=Colletotrichum scovillei TaxID=1209932 RepID=A0A9P7UHE2_9PEZI|nr:uncharacterized protein HER10_EVM0006529 [Colletotrichum scovillei]KAF4779775.1 hypothetical protein HER10_EVM0006529 [Colletotrichum scovillei]KAG7057250.1 integral membrane protein [Colletotrichum scovillei]KAG7075816.1 integral membrane protein [Colletotrichum scovillei]KAG7082931.1 integral membrane protein [Colletotrichum scovillei]
MPPRVTGNLPFLVDRSIIPYVSNSASTSASAAAAAATTTAAANTTIPPWLILPRPDPNEWNGASVVPVAVLSAVVATAFVAMRFYTRARILRSVKWEDWTILASLIFAIATSGGMITQLNFGLGQHLYYSYPSFAAYIEAGIFTNLFYSVSLTLTKISILLLYIRILTYDSIRLLGKILLGVVVLSHAWIIASILTTCVPLHSAWDYDPLNPPVYCHPISVFWGNACLHLATDFLIFLLPLPVIHTMRLPRRQKTGLYIVFCLAFLVCAISIVRLVRLFHTDETPLQVMDVTWSAVRIANLTCVEVHAAIVTACLTTLKPLLCRLFPRFMASATGGNTTGGGIMYSSYSAYAAAAADAARREEWEKNFSHGDPEMHYQRPLTIGTKSNRPRAQRDTFASLDDLKFSPYEEATEHEEHVDVLTTMKPPARSSIRGGSRGSRDEFRLAEVDAGAPLRWPSTLVRKSRLQPPQGAKTRGSMLRYAQTVRSMRFSSAPMPENRI